MEGTSHYTATVYLGNRSAIYLADLGARSAIYKHYRLAACLADYGLSQYRCVRAKRWQYGDIRELVTSPACATAASMWQASGNSSDAWGRRGVTSLTPGAGVG